MKRLSFFIAALLTVITMTGIHSCKSTSKASTTKLLKFNLEKGKGYDYEMVMDMTTKASSQEIKMSMEGAYSMNVTDISGGIRSVTTAYKSIKMNIQMMGMTIDIDTDKPVEGGDGDMKTNPLGAMKKILSSMVGKPFVIKVDEEGNVLEITGFDKIMGDIIDSMGLDETMKAQVRASLKDQFSEKSMKDNFAQMFTIFPNKEVKVGDSWVKTYSLGGKMPAKLTTTYTVKEIEGDHVTLTTKTKIESNGDMDMTGDQQGNIIVDSKTGLMVNSEINQDMTVTAQGQKISITSKIKIKGKAN